MINLTWEAWLRKLFPGTYAAPLADYHRDFWEWLWDCAPDQSDIRPYVAVWPRGWAKSTNGEVAAVALGAKGFRYVLYVSSRQPQADDHVGNIAARLESDTVALAHPELAEPQKGKFGNQRAWRRQRVITSGGFTVDAIGLDAAIRGAKLDDARPDCIILDDVDEDSDSVETVAKKIRAVTTKILPTAAPNCVVMVLQNLVHRNGIVAQLVDGRADYLAARLVSGPHPAILDMETEGSGADAVITGGVPTWPFLGLAECQAKIRLFGLRAFLIECQHEIALSGQPRFNLEALDYQTARDPLPDKALPGNLWGIEGLRVYALPVPGGAYVQYTDPAEGKGRDYCATVWMDARSKQVVAVLEDNTREPTKHADVAVDVGEYYRVNLTGFERARDGAIALVFGQRGVERIYHHVDTQPTDAQRAAGTQPIRRPGYPMTADTKRALIDRLGGAIDSIATQTPDRRMLEQARSFIVTERMTTEAEAGGHDDLVIAWAGCCMLADTPGATQLREQPRGPAVRGYTPEGARGSYVRGY